MATTCRTCHAPVRWVVTRDGKRMPVDAEPIDGGNLVLSAGEPPSAFVVDPGQVVIDDGPRYRSHFATCPQAAQHRRTR